MDTSTPALRALADISNHFNVSRNSTPCPQNGPKDGGCKKQTPPALGFLRPPDQRRETSSLALVTLASQVRADEEDGESGEVEEGVLRRENKRGEKRKRGLERDDEDQVLLPSTENTQPPISNTHSSLRPPPPPTGPKVRAIKKMSRGIARPKTKTQRKAPQRSAKPRRTSTSTSTRRQSRQGAVFTVDKINEDPVSKAEMRVFSRGSVDSFIDDECEGNTARRARKRQKVTGVHWKVVAEAELSKRDGERENKDAELIGWKKVEMKVGMSVTKANVKNKVKLGKQVAEKN